MSDRERLAPDDDPLAHIDKIVLNSELCCIVEKCERSRKPDCLLCARCWTSKLARVYRDPEAKEYRENWEVEMAQLLDPRLRGLI